MNDNMIAITSIIKSVALFGGIIASVPAGRMLAETVTINEDTNIPLGVACGVGFAAITATASFMSIKFGQKNLEKRVGRIEEKLDSLPCRDGHECSHNHKKR